MHTSGHNLRVLCLYLSFAFVLGELNPLRINKCCPQGKMLASPTSCKDIVLENGTEIGNFSWFPMDLIVNATTLKIHNEDRGLYLDILENHYEINYGMIPECEPDDTKEYQFSWFNAERSWFHFIIDSDMAMSLHISKPETHHDSEKFQNFQFETASDYLEVAPRFLNEPMRTITMQDVCVDVGNRRELQYYLIMYCPCRSMPCIRKCCDDREVLNHDGECIDPEVDVPKWRPEMNDELYYVLSNVKPSSCPDYFRLNDKDDNVYCNQNQPTEEFTVLPNGSVKVKNYKEAYPSDLYCGDMALDNKGTLRPDLLICGVKAIPPKSKPIKFVLYGSLLIVAGFCLVATVTISLLLPELKRRTHNKIALCHNASLMVACFSEGIGQITTKTEDKTCIFLTVNMVLSLTLSGLLMQFSFLGSFFWLNVMCIDISMTFSKTFRSVSQSGSKKFLYYSIYSWGSTAIISAVTIAIEFMPDLPEYVLKPGFTCTSNCSFNTATIAVFIYFYGPMSVLLLLNLVLFIITTVKILRVQRQTAVLHQPGSTTSQSDKQRFILYVRLFLLMGLTWGTEIANWAIGGPDYYWYIPDILNLLRGVFIFILFICKKSVLRNLKRRFLDESLSWRNSDSDPNVLNSVGSTRSNRFRMRSSSGKATAKRESSSSKRTSKKHSAASKTEQVNETSI